MRTRLPQLLGLMHRDVQSRIWVFYSGPEALGARCMSASEVQIGVGVQTLSTG